jgi:hypothetical protein
MSALCGEGCMLLLVRSTPRRGGPGPGCCPVSPLTKETPPPADYILITGGQNGQTPLADAYLLSVCPYIRYGQSPGVHALAGYPATCATLRWRWPMLLAYKPQGSTFYSSLRRVRSRRDTFREERIEERIGAARSSDTATNFSLGILSTGRRASQTTSTGCCRPCTATRRCAGAAACGFLGARCPPIPLTPCTTLKQVCGLYRLFLIGPAFGIRIETGGGDGGVCCLFGDIGHGLG